MHKCNSRDLHGAVNPEEHRLISIVTSISWTKKIPVFRTGIQIPILIRRFTVTLNRLDTSLFRRFDVGYPGCFGSLDVDGSKHPLGRSLCPVSEVCGAAARCCFPQIEANSVNMRRGLWGLRRFRMVPGAHSHRFDRCRRLLQKPIAVSRDRCCRRTGSRVPGRPESASRTDDGNGCI